MSERKKNKNKKQKRREKERSPKIFPFFYEAVSGTMTTQSSKGLCCGGGKLLSTVTKVTNTV